MSMQVRLWVVVAVQAPLMAWSAHAMASKVYVANEDGRTVSVLDGTTFKTVATLRVGKLPHNVQVAPVGGLA